MIHVCYAFTDKKCLYSQIIGASISSLFSTTEDDVTVHLIHDKTLSEKNFENFKRLAYKFDRQILFYNLDELLPCKIAKLRNSIDSILNERLTIGAMYRFFIPHLIPEDRIIYLDGDTIVNIDIGSLWNEDLEGFVLGAVPDVVAAFGDPRKQHLITIGKVTKETYFCSGVLLIDLVKFREFTTLIEDGLEVLRKYPECTAMDQDILNYFFAKSYKHLDLKYNIYTSSLRRSRYMKKLENSVVYGILHFAGDELTALPAYNIDNMLWLSFFSETPWHNHTYTSKLLIDINKNIDRNREITLNLIKAIRQKEPIFFYDGKFAFSEDRIRKYFSFLDNLEIHEGFEVETKDMLKGKIGFFFFDILDYNNVRNELTQLGFIEGEDFVNGFLMVNDDVVRYELMRIPYAI